MRAGAGPGVPERGCRLSNCAESASVMRTHCGIVARQPARVGAPGPTSAPADPLAPTGTPPLLRAGVAPCGWLRAGAGPGVPERGCRLSNCAESASVMRTHRGIVARQPARVGAPGPTSTPADPLAPGGTLPLPLAAVARYRSARARVDPLSGLNPGGIPARAPGTRSGRSCRQRSRRRPGHGRPDRGRPRA